MSDVVVLSEVDGRGVATVTLNRPEVHNAYDGAMIDGLAGAIGALAADSEVRVVVLRANGKHFQAGADLNWLKQVAGFSPEQNLDFSLRTTRAMRGLNECPKPTLALVHGACFGGGVGMVAACDIVVATETARFALTEVRWGVIPAPIIPQLCSALGVRGMRRYGITGERFDANEARRMGLVHEICPDGGFDEVAAPILDALLSSGPEAVEQSKRLVLEEAGLELSEQRVRSLSVQGAIKRASPEAEEGLKSFIEKRKPAWYPAD